MRVLILGGTTEASTIASALANDPRYTTVLSLAGRTRAPMEQPVPVRVGGFGGAKGLAFYLRDERIAAMIDATHPFAHRIRANAVLAASAEGIPRIAVLRPPWEPVLGDDWRVVATMQEAFEAIGALPQHVFLTVGQKELAPFLPPHRYLIRSVDAPDLSAFAAEARTITARGPFDETDELALMRDNAIDVLVTKNSGGEATAAKLAAARKLGLPVVMVARPDPPPGETVQTAAQAVDWLARQGEPPLWRGV
jgi:precorrin-6A/cobalt-precorrin-6A reductase